MQASDKYPHVFTPFRIGKVEVRNRIFLPAHTTNFAENFLPTDRHKAYLVERAKGGIGLIFLEPLRVHRTSLGRAGGISGAVPASLPKLRGITDAIKAEGARAFTQITHTGRHSDNFTDRLPAWGPSPVPWTTSGEIPHTMTRREMDEVTDSYVRTARFAVEAGFEGLEVHFGHGHLLHQFLSPACNVREDEYGGAFENRLRYPLEVFDAVLGAVGKQIEIGVRVSVADLMHGGMSQDESFEAIRRAAQRQGCKFVHASVAAYHWPSIGHHVADMSYPSHPYLDDTLRLHDVLGDMPLLAVNRYTSLKDCEDALATGKIAMVGMNRAHMADPYIIAKTIQGNENDIRPCISSNHCIGQIALHRPAACMMNPRMGKESEWSEPPEPARHRKRVLVVGGGPAGLEAARVASLRGHNVVLWEAGSTLGGRLLVGELGHGRADLKRMRKYLVDQLERTSTKVELAHVADPQGIASFAPDVVILSIGSQVEALPPGMTGTVEEAIADTSACHHGRHVAIFDKSGSWAGLSAAETLAFRGADVTVFSSPDSPFWDVNIYSRMTAMERLEQQGVKLRPGHVLLGIREGRALMRNKFSAEQVDYGPFECFLYASRGISAFVMQSEIERLGITVVTVGDALAPHSLFEAIYDANAAARLL
ncbi:oxidoreductase [Candidimonas nitroreducens]|uniref:NADH:flavin oxidoreductase n=1 Tax=Candidimonas nitroreducens TaxID=683354 RepID=A0A225MRU5_9BURK|nr:FAD-dependent oxidoreductase [Candidimonas nitroreducens]OWT63938.1 hypothetical protein CEY11_06450 [Candidimonas nitroreducens]